MELEEGVTGRQTFLLLGASTEHQLHLGEEQLWTTSVSTLIFLVSFVQRNHNRILRTAFYYFLTDVL